MKKISLIDNIILKNWNIVAMSVIFINEKPLDSKKEIVELIKVITMWRNNCWIEANFINWIDFLIMFLSVCVELAYKPSNYIFLHILFELYCWYFRLWVFETFENIFSFPFYLFGVLGTLSWFLFRSTNKSVKIGYVHERLLLMCTPLNFQKCGMSTPPDLRDLEENNRESNIRWLQSSMILSEHVLFY